MTSVHIELILTVYIFTHNILVTERVTLDVNYTGKYYGCLGHDEVGYIVYREGTTMDGTLERLAG